MQIDDKWFDDLYMENAPQMVKMAACLLNDQSAAEELVDEAFLILLSKRQTLVHHPNLPGWLRQTLKFLVSNELNSARHRLESPLETEKAISSDDTYKPGLSESLPKGLKPKEREILLLFYEEQLSHEQIAKRLDITNLNCRTRLYRAKMRLKELITEEKIF